MNFNMDVFEVIRIFLIHVLFAALYLFYSSGSTTLDGTNTGCLPRLVKIVDVKPTTESATATAIYLEHGVGNKKNMCRSANKKTRYIIGYSLCKKAAKVSGQMPSEDSEIIDAKCSWVQMHKNYKHRELLGGWFSNGDRNDNRYDYDDRTCCLPLNRNRSDNYGHVMVECVATTNDNRNPTKVAFRLLHARKDIYYIFEAKGYYPDILQTAMLRYDDRDYPTITVETTGIDLKMDDIFGQYGVMESKNAKHVCRIDKNTNMLVGQPLCELALEKLELQILRDMDSSCINAEVHRFEPTNYFWGYKFKSKVRGMMCWYRNSPSSIQPYHILITNVPVPEKDYYYIFALKDNNNKKGKNKKGKNNELQYKLIRIEELVKKADEKEGKL